MTTYRTPDVYVEEISLFPPSVAEVETAVPAFIGYTAKADRVAAGDLRNAPTKIKSLPEFETFFGGAPPVAPSEVLLDEKNNFVKATFATDYYLYDSLRLFFDNGGGKCYIVSVGSYEDDIDPDALEKGLKAVAKFDEPTLILFPDAASGTLTASQLGNLQKLALAQCAKLKDRFCLFDTLLADVKPSTDYTPASLFRDNIGINNLKYGAAYSPWLKIDYSKNVSYENVKGVLMKGTTSIQLADLTGEKGIKELIESLENALDDAGTVAAAMKALAGSDASVAAKFEKLLAAFTKSAGADTLRDLYALTYEIAGKIDDLQEDGTGVKLPDLQKDIRSAIGSALKSSFMTLVANEKEIDTKLDDDYTAVFGTGTVPGASAWDGVFKDKTPAASTDIPATVTDEAEVCKLLIPKLGKSFNTINETLKSFHTSALKYAKTFEDRLHDTFTVYRNIVKGINDTATTIPPSGAIAGVYAMVDSQRGVWKAPANVSLNGVIGPSANFDLDDTNDLNVDATAGKSVNAIRAFAGKGTLVWGARTLAGNDNEWRYVSVRRFFNMVEESVKKSTYWAVFEPNDANTWVKVRGMIENYLMQKWREGALAGATPKDAFFVKCGLGITMSAQDILEGRMNVEIGMAVVRPAEFIILKFSHKLQTS